MNNLRALKDKGLEELESFQNRVYRQKGLGRISNQDFLKLSEQVEKLIETVHEIEENDNKPYEK